MHEIIDDIIENLLLKAQLWRQRPPRYLPAARKQKSCPGTLKRKPSWRVWTSRRRDLLKQTKTGAPSRLLIGEAA